MEKKINIDIQNLDNYIIMDSTNIKEYYKNYNPFVDLVITSPPYFDAKVYNNGEIKETGLNQSYEEYLNDIKVTFEGVYNICKSNASLYLNIDTIKRDSKIKRLPDDIARILEEIGWIHKDTIIWDKVKTLPYSRKGQARNVFEYILLFTKSDTEYKYYEDRIKSIEPMHWWLKHPEKYSPNGIAPSNIWRFSIPPQGSWGLKAKDENGVLKHSCPFPPELITRIVLLGSDINDIVMDPYAGTGIALHVSKKLNRKYIGFDISKSSKNIFNNGAKKFVDSRWDEILAYYKFQENIKPLYYKTIINLRAMKFAKILLKKFNQKVEFSDNENLIGCLVLNINNKNHDKYADIKYLVVVENLVNLDKYQNVLIDICNKKPLSKYGIKNSVLVIDKTEINENLEKLYPVYLYNSLNIESYIEKIYNYIDLDINIEKYKEVVISNIELNKENYEVLLEETKSEEKKKSYKKLCKKYKINLTEND